MEDGAGLWKGQLVRAGAPLPVWVTLLPVTAATHPQSVQFEVMDRLQLAPVPRFCSSCLLRRWARRAFTVSRRLAGPLYLTRRAAAMAQALPGDNTSCALSHRTFPQKLCSRFYSSPRFIF